MTKSRNLTVLVMSIIVLVAVITPIYIDNGHKNKVSEFNNTPHPKIPTMYPDGSIKYQK